MGYIVRKRRRGPKRGYAALGDLLSTLSTAVNVETDPYFAETVCHVNQLKDIKNNVAVRDCPPTPPGLPGGVGLDAAQAPLRFYVYGKENLWVFPVVGALILATPFMLGFWVGKGKL